MDDNVEIDDDGQCLKSGDNDYWVEAWVYIPADEIRFETARSTETHAKEA